MHFTLIITLRILIAAFLGAIIGIERELNRKEAGLRTHILVCIGSTLIMLTSVYIFDIYKGIANVDPSRIASNVVTGIGFIGAGAIIRYGTSVRGLTTAATLWLVSAIGLAVGCGFYVAAVSATFISVLILLLVGKFERRMPHHVAIAMPELSKDDV
jgi:putative Mg2+ transporter-C (MgtC) family protein